MCFDFLCGIIHEFQQPKSFAELLIASFSGFLGAGFGVYYGNNQANKIKLKQDQVLREVLLKN
jgi:hypothetical protein